MFTTYTNGSRTIRATELAYKVIYREQGFMPADEVKVTDEPVEPDGGSPGEGVDADADGAADKNGSGEPDTGEAQTAKRRRKSE